MGLGKWNEKGSLKYELLLVLVAVNFLPYVAGNSGSSGDGKGPR